MLNPIVFHLLNIESIYLPINTNSMRAYYLSFTPQVYLSDQLLMQLSNVNYAIELCL